MNSFVAISLLLGLGMAVYFLLVRDFPLMLATVSGVSVGALVFAALSSLSRLRKQLTTPTLKIERSEDGNDTPGE